MRTALAILTFVALGSAALADEVLLANGATITGRVEDAGDQVIVHVPGGLMRIDRREIVGIERGPLPADLYAARAAATDPSDPKALRGLAEYATGLGLLDIARSLRSTADGVELERRAGALAPDDAAGFRDLARWARSRGLGREVERYLYDRAVRADPGDEESRAALSRLAEEERRARRDEDLAAIERAAREAEAARQEAARAAADAEEARRRVEEEHRRRLELERELVRLRNERRDGAYVFGDGSVYPGRVVVLYPPRRPPVAKPKPPRRDPPPHRDRRLQPAPSAHRAR